MPEARREVRTFLVKYQCDKCGGDVRPNGIMLPMNPPKYQHDCTECGEGYIFYEVYPVVRYEEVEVP